MGTGPSHLQSAYAGYLDLGSKAPSACAFGSCYHVPLPGVIPSPELQHALWAICEGKVAAGGIYISVVRLWDLKKLIEQSEADVFIFGGVSQPRRLCISSSDGTDVH